MAATASMPRPAGLRDGRRPPLVFPGYWLYAPDGGPSCLHIADRIAYRAHAATLGLGEAVSGAGSPAAGGGAVDHIAFEADEHDGVRERIAARGLRAVLSETPGGPRQLFVYDPGGVLVEVNVPAPPDRSAWPRPGR